MARRVDTGRLEILSPRVFRLVGAPETPRQRAMAAVLDAGPGSLASHATAAWLWGIPGFGVREPETSRLRGSCGWPVALSRLHEPRLLPLEHVTTIDAIPTTTAERALCDLAGTLHPIRVERALDSALAAGRADMARMWLTFGDLSARGRPGRQAMRRILAERPPGYVAPESELEARFVALVGRSGLAQPERQVEVGGDGWIGRVDFLFRGAGLVVEVDGRAHHTALVDRRADAERDAALRAAGFEVLRFGWDDVVLHSERTAMKLRSALRAAAT